VSEFESSRGIVGTDPELRLAISRHCQKLDPAVAGPVLDALNELHPQVVLETYFEVLTTVLAPESPRF
jgi:hypothetical protein